MTVREGENATLTCRASGHPQPRIIWKREDGEKIVLRRGFRDVYKGEPIPDKNWVIRSRPLKFRERIKWESREKIGLNPKTFELGRI